MQIVRDLAGYTMGRSDLVRRAMSKKKTAVMEKERQNFVYGNLAEGVSGCVGQGIDEKTANHIYDEMIDFAKYAFNKSHAVCYAVVAYETAYLKYYYPKEFMAALMTSVMDNIAKVSEYILTCRQMGIEILSPDLNEGQSGFSVSGNAIRYGLSAIKSVGRHIVDAIIEERQKGAFLSIDDFVERMGGKEINRRTLESFIKSGAMDSMPGNRRQKMMVAPELLEQRAKEKKHMLEGQMSLFDFAAEEERDQFRVTMPQVAEYPKEELLAYEKEILGVYISGHPLEGYRKLWKAGITAKTTDFLVDEDLGRAVVSDNSDVVIGGMVTGKVLKITKTGKMMAFVTLEDLVGSVEILVFPKVFEQYRALLEEEAKIFVRGRASVGDEPVGKLICEQVIPFTDASRELWLRFSDKSEYEAFRGRIMEILKLSEGKDEVVIYLEKERAKKVLPANWKVAAEQVIDALLQEIGEKNVKLVERGLKRLRK